MSPKFVLISCLIGIYFLASTEGMGLGDENLSSSIQEILAQARRLENEDGDGHEYASSNQRSNHRDLTNVLGVDKRALYENFLTMQNDVDSSDSSSDASEQQPEGDGIHSYDY